MSEPTPHTLPAAGWIEVIVGSMYSGKTEELIRRLRRAQIARQKVEIFKPVLDGRYARNHIVSHSELRIPSRAVRGAREILRHALEAQVIGIDEGATPPSTGGPHDAPPRRQRRHRRRAGRAPVGVRQES